MEYREIVRFHGHSCPGLAIGHVMTQAALTFLQEERSPDEELVAIVENDACGVDALQCVSGCTFGKGNLIFRDYGKHVYTLCARATGRGVRVVFNEAAVPEGLRQDREQFIAWLLAPGGERCVSVTPATIELPECAQIRTSILCQECGEGVMSSRLQEVAGKAVCIPCSEMLTGSVRIGPAVSTRQAPGEASG
jgi:formylmethanofuran dehydrogenase subunit E